MTSPGPWLFVDQIRGVQPHEGGPDRHYFAGPTSYDAEMESPLQTMSVVTWDEGSFETESWRSTAFDPMGSPLLDENLIRGMQGGDIRIVKCRATLVNKLRHSQVRFLSTEVIRYRVWCGRLRFLKFTRPERDKTMEGSEMPSPFSRDLQTPRRRRVEPMDSTSEYTLPEGVPFAADLRLKSAAVRCVLIVDYLKPGEAGATLIVPEQSHDGSVCRDSPCPGDNLTVARVASAEILAAD